MSEAPRIFVSHSHEDDAFCQRLIGDLRTRLGEDAVWFDTSGGLHGSDDWWDRIIAEITERPYFLVVLSPSAAESKWVPQEMKMAFRQHVELGKRLLPVRLSPSPRRPDWESIQEFDFTSYMQPGRYSAALEDLLRAVGVDPSTLITVAAIGAEQAPHLLSPNERLAQETHTAYGREHWSDVLDKTGLLIERDVMTLPLWRERASAAFALNRAQMGLEAAQEALKLDPDDVDTLLLHGRLYLKVGDDEQAVATFTRAYALSPLDDTATRLLILDDLTKILARLKQWDEFNLRMSDARRMSPADLRLAKHHLETLFAADRPFDVVMASQAVPSGMSFTSLLPAWRAAIAKAVEQENWKLRHDLINAARDVGTNSDVIEQWRRFDFPRFMRALTFAEHDDAVYGVAWSPDGAKLATASGDQLALIWEASSGKVLHALEHDAALNGVAWSPDGTRLATASDDQMVSVWDVESGELLDVLSGHDGEVYSVTWSPDGDELATASADKTVRIWKMDESEQVRALEVPGDEAWRVAWSPNGIRLAIAGTNHIVHVWELDSEQEQVRLADHGDTVNDIAWSCDGRRLATACDDKVARVWMSSNGRLLASLAGHDDAVSSVAWSPDEMRLATGSADQKGIVWDVDSEESLVVLEGHVDMVNSVAWSPDGTRLASAGADGIVIIWEED